MKSMRAILFIGFLWVVTETWAQPAVELKKISDRFNTPASYSADLVYAYYDTYITQEAGEKMNGKYIKKNTSTYLKIGYTETVTTDSYIFSVDHEDKNIEILERKKKTGKPSNPLSFKLDTLLKLKHTIRPIQSNAGIGIYEIESDFMEYEKVQIHFNKKTYDMVKMVLFFSTQMEEEFIEHEGGFEVVEKEGTAPRLEISYNNIKVNEEISDEVFSYNKFVGSSGYNKFYCKPEYKNYRIN